MGTWVHPYADTPLEVGVVFRKIGGMAESEQCLKVTVEAQHPIDCTPHPYHIYAKCFSTLLCCGWAYGCTLTLLRLCRWVLGNLGAWLSPSDVLKSWLRLQTPVNCIPHPHHIDAKCFSTLICYVDGHMGAPLHCYACAGGF